MIDCWNSGDAVKTQISPMSPTNVFVGEGSGISLTQLEGATSTMSEISPSDVVLVGRSTTRRPRRSLKASIWLKLTLFIGTLVWSAPLKRSMLRSGTSDLLREFPC